MKKYMIFLFMALFVLTFSLDYTSILNLNFGPIAMAAGSNESVDIDDYQSILTNPSLLAMSQWSFIKVSHLKYLDDTNFSYLGIGKYIEGIGNISLSYLYGNYGFQDERDISGTTRGEFFSYDQALALTIADRFYTNSYYGFNIKYLEAQYGDNKTSSLLFDLGLSFRIKKFLIGMYMKNFGTKMQFETQGDFNQVVTGIGWRYRYNFKNHKNAIILLNDYNAYSDELMVNYGVKFIMFKYLTIATGVHNVFDSYAKRLNLGLSYSLQKFLVSFAYNFNSNYGSLYDVGLEFRW
ncbi:hypothetical protein J7L48_11205 [bacterium]|nr:hypothetical protein [bacterium]